MSVAPVQIPRSPAVYLYPVLPSPHSLRRMVGRFGISALWLLGLGGAMLGCATPEVTVKNPLASGGALAPSRIAKPHSWAESSSGLPPGSMTDEAVLDTLDAQQLCVTVTLQDVYKRQSSRCATPMPAWLGTCRRRCGHRCREPGRHAAPAIDPAPGRCRLGTVGLATEARARPARHGLCHRNRVQAGATVQ